MKQLINSTNLKKAHLMDFFEVMNIVASFLKKEDIEALKLKSVTEEFTNGLDDLEKALTQARKTGITERLLEADHLRDNIFTGFNLVLKGMIYFPEEAIAQAAVTITNVLQKYGKGIKELPQREETAVLINQVQDLKSDDYKKQVEIIGLTTWVEKLEKANNTFEKLYTERTEKEAEFVVGLSRTERDNMQQIFEKLCHTIDAYAFLEGDAPYKSLAEKINTEVDNVQQAIKARLNN